MQNLNDNVTSTSDTMPRSDRRILIWHRALMLGPWMLIVAGLIEDPVSRLVEPVAFVILILAWLTFLLFLFWVNRSMLKDNPRLKKALLSLSVWTPVSGTYRERVMELDEREKLVVDQAFRTSYRILASVCTIVLFFLLLNIDYLHLPYSPGQGGDITIILGSVALMGYLPASVAAWREGV